jgi:tripartite-type tricarboxylate transporter receptor subunit TctC
VRFLVPFAPGGTSEIVARSVAAELTKGLGQSVFVENKPGGAGTVAMVEAAKSVPDGHTLILGHVGTLAVNPYMLSNQPYDVNKDFMPVTMLAKVPNVFVIHPDVPAKTFQEFIAYAKKNPGKLDYGFIHAASGHMAMELFKQTAGLELTGIPYKGGGPMLIDLLAGVIPVMFTNGDAALTHVRAGKMRAIAVSSAARDSLYPDVPTIAESGYKGFEALSWSGMSVAKGTPQAVVDKLEAAISQAMQSDTIRQRMTSVGFVVPPQGSKHYTAFVKSELDTWVRVIKTAGIKPE